MALEKDMQIEFKKQFSVELDYYLKNLDFLNWYRYYFIVKEVIELMPKSILEIGPGSGIVKNCLKPMVELYIVMDINPKLNPDILADVREYKEELERKFECIIIADVLEHMPFIDSEKSLKNLYNYLKKGGKVIITIPHRGSYFLIMTPTYKPHVISIPTGFLSLGSFYRRFIKRKIWIDPHHCWEIGDGNIKKNDVEIIFKKVGFEIEKFKKLLYVDFWVLKK